MNPLTKQQVQAARPMLEFTHYIAMKMLQNRLPNIPWQKPTGKVAYDRWCRAVARGIVDTLEETAEP